MDRIECTAVVDEKHQALVQLPENVTPGKHHIVVLINDPPNDTSTRAMKDLLSISAGAWPAGLSLRREDMYDDG